MRNIVVTLVMFSLVSCRAPQIKPQTRCTVSFEFETCFCHDYDLMKQERVSDVWEEPLEVCDDITGFFAEKWAKEITPWAKQSRRYYEDECK